MARNLFTLVLLLLIASSAQAQRKPVCEWAKVDTAMNIIINPSFIKNAVGASADKVLWVRVMNRKSIFNQAVVGDHEAVIYDTAGNKLQSFMVQGKVYFEQVLADAAGNWYLGGRYVDTVQFPGHSPYIRASGSMPDKFICRLNANTLNVDWFTTVGAGYQSTVHQFTISNGKIYTWGDSMQSNIVYSIDMNTGHSTVIVRQQRAGYVSSIATDKSGNIYLAGSCPSLGTVHFGNQPDTINKQYIVYVVRYTPDGQFDWISKMNDFTCTGRKLSIGDDNTIYYTGTVNDSLTIGTYKFDKPRIMGGNMLVACYDSNGVVKWAMQPTDSAGIVRLNYNLHAVPTDSGIMVLPVVNNSIDWGSGLKTTASKNFTLGALVNFYSSGSASWETHTTSLNLMPINLISNGKDVWISGIVRDSSAFKMDNVSEPVKALWNNPFVAKLKMPASVQPPDTTDTTTAVMVIDEKAFMLYPNPATKRLVIERQDGTGAPFLLTIFNTSGVVVYRQMMDDGPIFRTVDVSAFNRGMYFVELQDKNVRVVKKVLLR